MPSEEKSMHPVWVDGGLAALPLQDVETRSDKKITFNLSRIDDNGLYGPPDGKRALLNAN